MVGGYTEAHFTTLSAFACLKILNTRKIFFFPKERAALELEVKLKKKNVLPVLN